MLRGSFLRGWGEWKWVGIAKRISPYRIKAHRSRPTLNVSREQSGERENAALSCGKNGLTVEHAWGKPMATRQPRTQSLQMSAGRVSSYQQPGIRDCYQPSPVPILSLIYCIYTYCLPAKHTRFPHQFTFASNAHTNIHILLNTSATTTTTTIMQFSIASLVAILAAGASAQSFSYTSA